MGNRRVADPQDSALWTSYAASVKALGRDRAPLASARRRQLTVRPLGPADPATLTVPDAGIGNNLDRATEKRLRRGQILPEGRIDLHGLTRERAGAVLWQRLAQSQLEGRRCVLVITGKGRDPARPGALREAVPQWLGEPRFARLIHAFRPAHDRHGGSGACYVFLRKRG